MSNGGWCIASVCGYAKHPGNAGYVRESEGQEINRLLAQIQEARRSSPPTTHLTHRYTGYVMETSDYSGIPFIMDVNAVRSHS